MIIENTIKADISASASGDNTIISAPAGTSETLVIDHINLIPDGAVSLQIKSGETNYGGLYSLTANQGFILENVIGDENGIIKCGANEAFILNLSAAVQISGFVKYRIKNR